MSLTKKIDEFKNKLIVCGKRVDVEFDLKIQKGIVDNDAVDFVLTYYGLSESFPVLRYFYSPLKSYKLSKF